MEVSTGSLLFYGIILEEGENISSELFDKTEFNDKSEIGIENYCYGNSHIYAVSIKKSVKKSVKRVSRRYPEKVNGKSKKNRSWDIILKKFCVENNINYSNEPYWYLASYWE